MKPSERRTVVLKKSPINYLSDEESLLDLSSSEEESSPVAKRRRLRRPLDGNPSVTSRNVLDENSQNNQKTGAVSDSPIVPPSDKDSGSIAHHLRSCKSAAGSTPSIRRPVLDTANERSRSDRRTGTLSRHNILKDEFTLKVIICSYIETLLFHVFALVQYSPPIYSVSRLIYECLNQNTFVFTEKWLVIAFSRRYGQRKMKSSIIKFMMTYLNEKLRPQLPPLVRAHITSGDCQLAETIISPDEFHMGRACCVGALWDYDLFLQYLQTSPNLQADKYESEDVARKANFNFLNTSHFNAMEHSMGEHRKKMLLENVQSTNPDNRINRLEINLIDLMNLPSNDINEDAERLSRRVSHKSSDQELDTASARPPGDSKEDGPKSSHTPVYPLDGNHPEVTPMNPVVAQTGSHETTVHIESPITQKNHEVKLSKKDSDENKSLQLPSESEDPPTLGKVPSLPLPEVRDTDGDDGSSDENLKAVDGLIDNSELPQNGDDSEADLTDRKVGQTEFRETTVQIDRLLTQENQDVVVAGADNEGDESLQMPSEADLRLGLVEVSSLPEGQAAGHDKNDESEEFGERSRLLGHPTDTFTVSRGIDEPLSNISTPLPNPSIAITPELSVDTETGRWIDDFAELLESSRFSDVTIIVKDEKFSAHKLVLATRSSVFAAIFENKEIDENKKNVIEIEKMEPSIVKRILEFIYTDDVSNLDEISKGLLPAADKYNLVRLRALCEKSLAKTLSHETAVEILVLAHLHHSDNLKKHVMHFMENHLTDIINSEDYKKMERYPALLMDFFRFMAQRKLQKSQMLKEK